MKPVSTSRQNLVAVGLVADVPNDLVFRGVEDVMQRHSQLDHAQAGAKVPTFLGHHVDDELAQFVRDLLQFLWLEFGAQVRRKSDLRKEGAGSVSIHGSRFKG